MVRIPIGAAVRDTISGWRGKVVKRPAGRHPPGTLHVLFDGTANSICVGVTNLTYVARNYAAAVAMEADQHPLYEPLSVGGSSHG